MPGAVEGTGELLHLHPAGEIGFGDEDATPRRRDDTELFERPPTDEAQVHALGHELPPHEHRARKVMDPCRLVRLLLQFAPAPEREFPERHLRNRLRFRQARAVAELRYCFLARAVRPAGVEAGRVVAVQVMRVAAICSPNGADFQRIFGTFAERAAAYGFAALLVQGQKPRYELAEIGVMVAIDSEVGHRDSASFKM